MAFYLFNPRLSVLATVAWFRARAGVLDQQGAAHFPKNVTLPCLSAKKEHKDFLLAQKALTALPDLISVFVSCYVWGTKRTWLGVWASTHRRVSSIGSLSFSLVLHMLEERRKCRRNQTQANRFSNSHHTRMFTHFSFFFFYNLRVELRHLADISDTSTALLTVNQGNHFMHQMQVSMFGGKKTEDN